MNCPHCGAVSVSFALLSEHKLSRDRSGSYDSYIVSGFCGSCEKGVFLEYQNRGSAQKSTPLNCPTDPLNYHWVMVETYPKAGGPRTLAHATEQLQRYFVQAENALKRGDWDASGAMSRKVVDVSIQQLLGADSKNYGTIKARIDALALKHAITPDLKDWAHEIRLGGNEAAHDEQPYTELEAKELFDFAELYLTYVYTLPGRLKERRDRATAGKSVAKT